jgi:hypothetical protein
VVMSVVIVVVAVVVSSGHGVLLRSRENG